MFKKLWNLFWRPSTKWGLGVLLIAGIFVGVAGWNIFHAGLELTTSTEFCIGCHTMRDNNFEEFKTTIHYSNPAGVRATCSDCHVPKGGWELYWAKLMAAKDVWGELTGTIDTREKFEEKRLEMAEQVWADMKANDSRGCRTCHSFEAMDFEHQTKPDAAAKMQVAMTDGSTCIDCHKGIAHHLPDMSSGYKKLFTDIEKAAEGTSKSGTVYAIKSTSLYAEEPTSDDPSENDGQILPLAKATVLKSDGKWIQIKLAGWTQEGVERLLVAEKGLRVIKAVVSSEFAKTIDTSGAEEDPNTGLNWSDDTITVWADSNDFTSNHDGLLTYGEEMAVATCSACHTMHGPEDFGANQWPGVIKDMKQNTVLDAEQLRFLQTYNQYFAKDMPKTDS